MRVLLIALLAAISYAQTVDSCEVCIEDNSMAWCISSKTCVNNEVYACRSPEDHVHQSGKVEGWDVVSSCPTQDSDIVTDAPTSTMCKDQPEKAMECLPGLPSAALATVCRNMAEFGGCDRYITDAHTTDENSCYVADICAETCGTCDPSNSSTQLADVIDNGLNTIVLGLAFVGVLTTFGAIIRCRQKGKYEKILDEEEI